MALKRYEEETGGSKMNELAKKQCKPCQGGVPPLKPEEYAPFLAQLDGWQVVDGHHLLKIFELPDYAKDLDIVNRIGTFAESQNHHPDLYLSWGKLEIKIWTHKIDGLSESDFIFAAKCDLVFKGMMAQQGRNLN